MPLSRFLAVFATLCTGLAMAGWLVLTVVVGGAMVGLGAGPSRAPAPSPTAAPAAVADRPPAATGAPAAAPSAAADAAPSEPSTAPSAAADGLAGARAADPTGAATAGDDETAGDAAGAADAGEARDAAGGDGDDFAATDGVSRLAVDWPTIPTLSGWTPLTTTASFDVYAEDPDNPVLRDAALRWAPRLEGLLDVVGSRLERDLPSRPVAVVFAPRYAADCPARGLAAPPDDDRRAPLVMVFVDADTGDLQVRAVLAHEIAHHLTMDDTFVGDGVLTEGIANWAASPFTLAWQGFDSWDAAARYYLDRGAFISVADPNGLVPTAGEACIGRRDRVYNVRSAFVAWLVERYGLETVLAMPETTVEVPAADGTPESRPAPDYAAATGASLAQLERRWLAELTADR